MYRHLYLIFVGAILFSCNRDRTEYDIIVYGGTPSGVVAAYAAGVEGKNVLLIEQTGHVGGMNSSGLNTAETEHMIHNSITGYADEVYLRLGKLYDSGSFDFSPRLKELYTETGRAYAFESHVIERVFLNMLTEAGVEVVYDQFVNRVVMNGTRIGKIEMTTGQVYSGTIYIDCTYEGDLMAKAGVSYTWGREDIGTYGESLAGMRFIDDTLKGRTVTANGRLHPFFVSYDPELHIPGNGDKRVNNYNFRPTMTRIDSNRLPLYPPDNYRREDFLFLLDYVKSRPNIRLGNLVGLYPRLNNKAAFNNQQNSTVSLGMFGGNRDYPDGSYEQRKEIYLEHKNYTLGYLYFLSHDQAVPDALRKEVSGWGYARDEYTDNNHFPYYLYIREARRLQGETVQTQRDIFTDRTKQDAITLGSHWVDAHHIQRIALSDSTYINEGRIWEVVDQPYEISYKIMLPKEEECTNLLVPVCVSVSHVAFCSVRLEPTWMQLGHAAGTAAAMVIDSLQSVHKVNIPALQERLEQQGMICNIGEDSMWEISWK